MKKEFSDKIKRLILPSRLVGYKMMYGSFRSRFVGEGLDFHSIRKYTPQDDWRYIDWNVTARTNIPSVKVYKTTQNITLFLCLDFSRSMHSCFNEIKLIDVAKNIAFIISLVAMYNSVPIGCLYFNETSSNLFMPSASKASIFKMLEKIDEEPLSKIGGSPLKKSLNQISSLSLTRSIIFVISDFYLTDYKDALCKLGTMHDAVTIKLVNNNDEKLPKVGTINFSDYESNFKKALPTSSSSFINKRKEEYKREIEEWKTISVLSRTHPLLINACDDLIKVLCNFFASFDNNIRDNK